jgi:tRNA A37 threonylcarbamoyladenosine synthetase subunit TsaC/SUA5/YrdC
MSPSSAPARLDVVASMEAIEPVARVIEDRGIAAISWGHPRRATYALLARADDHDATTRLNRLKGRPAGQVLAVVGATAVARRVVDLTEGAALGQIAAARALPPDALLDDLFRTGPVALLLEAAESVPPAIVKVDEAGRARVLVVGQAPEVEPDNFYDQLIDHLAMERGILVAGSSGNRSGRRTYTIWDHDAAADDFGTDVDVFVHPQLPIPTRRWWDAPVSCSGFDLTGSEPMLIRHGSLHPAVFRRTLGHYVVSPTVERIDGRQGLHAGMVECARRVR